MLNLDRWRDLRCTDKGCIAIYRPDIAPSAYDISINKPLRVDLVPKLMAFAPAIPRNAIETLFGLCNGMVVGRTKFALFGVLDEIGGGDHAHIPFDINIPNFYERPAVLGDEALILAHSRAKSAVTGVSLKFCHYIDREGVVSVASYDNLLSPERWYGNVTEWLYHEFEVAVAALEVARSDA